MNEYHPRDSTTKIVENIEILDKDTIKNIKTTTTTEITRTGFSNEIPQEAIRTLGAYAWPLVLLVLVIILKSNLLRILSALEQKILASRSVAISTSGITISGGESEIDAPVLDQAKVESKVRKDIPEPQRRILSTLWVHQMERDPDFNRRWSFALGPSHSEYESFANASNSLVFQGLIANNPKINQFFLTDAGITFCKNAESELNNFSYYRFNG